MTTKTTGHPGRMTREARHIFIAMRQLVIVSGHISPSRRIDAHRFRVTRLDTVILRMRGVRINSVDRLLHAPPTAGYNHRVLNNVAGFQLHSVAEFIFPGGIGADPLKQQHTSAVGSAQAQGREISPTTVDALSVFD